MPPLVTRPRRACSAGEGRRVPHLVTRPRRLCSAGRGRAAPSASVRSAGDGLPPAVSKPTTMTLDFGINAGLVEELFAQYLENAESVDATWRAFFKERANGNGAGARTARSPPRTARSPRRWKLPGRETISPRRRFRRGSTSYSIPTGSAATALLTSIPSAYRAADRWSLTSKTSTSRPPTSIRRSRPSTSRPQNPKTPELNN